MTLSSIRCCFCVFLGRGGVHGLCVVSEVCSTLFGCFKSFSFLWLHHLLINPFPPPPPPQAANESVKAKLRGLYITAAKQVQVDGGKRSAIIVFVPFNLLQRFRKVQKILVEELEKKFSGAHVVLIAQRTMYGKSYNRNIKYNGPRPRSRTLKHVQEAILDDMVYPTEIVGKRTRCRVDGSKQLRVHLNPKERVNVENKLDTFASVFKKLCNKEVVFEFPTRS